MGAAGTHVPGLCVVKCPGPHRETTLQPTPAKCRRSCPDPSSRGDTQASERRHSGGSPPHGSPAADTAAPRAGTDRAKLKLQVFTRDLNNKAFSPKPGSSSESHLGLKTTHKPRKENEITFQGICPSLLVTAAAALGAHFLLTRESQGASRAQARTQTEIKEACNLPPRPSGNPYV